MTSKPLKIGVVSLGCAKNLADTEAIIAALPQVKIVPINQAEIVLLNTCGFLKSARLEVTRTLKKLKTKKVIVLGCMAGLFKKSSFQKYPQIKAIVSSAHYAQINQILNTVAAGRTVYAVAQEPIVFDPTLPGKALLTSTTYAYVKIAEGCDNRCSYCLIPKLKGRYRSRQPAEILAEIKNLITLGVKEIILVAQDCGLYGHDLTPKTTLADLLNQITKIKGDFRVRILYLYPERLTDHLIKTIKKSPKICHYLDLPLQHGDPQILKQMNRPNNLKQIHAKIAHLRQLIPNITLRTSLIVGFPGETKTAFANLLKFVTKIRFDHLGVFTYSREKNTPAYHLKKQIPATTKKQRKNQVMLLQQKISHQKNRKLVGQTVKTLIEKFDPVKKLYFGRSQRFAPEVDGQILIKSNKKLALNTFYPVKITRTHPYDLEGEINPYTPNAKSRKKPETDE